MKNGVYMENEFSTEFMRIININFPILGPENLNRLILRNRFDHKVKKNANCTFIRRRKY